MRHSSRPAALALWCLVFLLGLSLWPQALVALGFSRPAYERGAVWQLFTSQLVHLNWPHTWVNALAFALSLLGWSTWVSLRDQMIALAGGMIGVALALALDPACAYYAGLSGALHGLWAGNAVALLGCSLAKAGPGATPTCPMPRAWQRHMALFILLLLLLKLGWQSDDPLEASAAWLGIPIYRPAHGAGLAGGLGLMGVVLLRRRSAASGCQPEREQ